MIEQPGIDPHIHQDELKLRLLLTDTCNQNCAFCLNDFQVKPKPGLARFLPLETALTAIRSYVNTLGDLVPIQIYLSGGEPTLHPNFEEILAAADKHCTPIVVTNGNFNSDTLRVLRTHKPRIHLGTYMISTRQAELAQKLDADIQTVLTKRNPQMDMQFLRFYLSHGLSVKVFMDFLEEDTAQYYDFVAEAIGLFGNEKLAFRYTGKQINRGPGCDECDITCITLKAAWIFPDGGFTPCPQCYQAQPCYPKTKSEWRECFADTYHFHTKIY